MDQVSQSQNQILSEQRQYNNQVLSAVAHLVQLVEESPSTQASLTSSLGNFRQLTLEPPPIANGTGVLMTKDKVSQSDGIVSTTGLRVSKVQKVNICIARCACKCHRFRRIGPPRILSNVFGHGYVMTAGSFFRKTQCDSALCKAQAAPRVSVQYHLPQWLAARMIFMWLTSCPPCSPELLLRVPRVVDGNNAAFRAVFLDVESFKLAITKGDCRPDDVDEAGNTILTQLVFQTDWQKLIHLSNYREYWNPSVTAPNRELVWHALILDPWKASYSDIPLRETLMAQISRLIDVNDHSESQGFAGIHQTVCGLRNVPLDVELQSSADIDTLDCAGRSALWYAVAQCRHDYVRILLERGADPNIGDPPFFKAVDWTPNFAIIKALLDHGAVLGPFNGISTLNWWANIKGPDTLAIDELLVKHGIDPNHRGDGGRTILMGIAQKHRPGVDLGRLKQMIELGSDIKIADEVGMTAIMHAAVSKFTDAFGILARAGARVDLKSAKGRTILHLAVAHEASWTVWDIPRLCEMFHDTDLTNLDLDAKDEDGHSAFDLLRLRNGPNWEDYCAHNGRRWYGPSDEAELEYELRAISALEDLLHYVQEVQDVPEADRYPPLGEYCSRIIEEDPVPGAWPMY
ncbi:ankyrin repeat-containing domain protein [Usnea florida]